MARTEKNTAKRPRPDGHSRDAGGTLDIGFGGLLGKFGNMLENLVNLAEAGESFSKSGEIKGLDPKGKLHGIYGLSVKMGLGDQGEREVKIEPFGNIHPKQSGETVVEDVREPLVDVHEEEDHLLVLAEIPGVSKKDVRLDISGDRLTIRAQRGEKLYHKEVDLPGTFSQDKMRWDCTNGILKIRLER